MLAMSPGKAFFTDIIVEQNKQSGWAQNKDNGKNSQWLMM